MAANGYILTSLKGKHLDRKGKWRKHKALCEAYVHAAETVLQGGPWVAVVKMVIPAEYDPGMDTARTTGTPKSYALFLVEDVAAAIAVVTDRVKA